MIHSVLRAHPVFVGALVGAFVVFVGYLESLLLPRNPLVPSLTWLFALVILCANITCWPPTLGSPWPSSAPIVAVPLFAAVVVLILRHRRRRPQG